MRPKLETTGWHARGAPFGAAPSGHRGDLSAPEHGSLVVADRERPAGLAPASSVRGRSTGRPIWRLAPRPRYPLRVRPATAPRRPRRAHPPPDMTRPARPMPPHPPRKMPLSRHTPSVRNRQPLVDPSRLTSRGPGTPTPAREAGSGRHRVWRVTGAVPGAFEQQFTQFAHPKGEAARSRSPAAPAVPGPQEKTGE